jgi:hypothetical protein
MTRAARAAILAFMFHGPGVVVLARETLGPTLLRDNVFALAATLAAVLAAAQLAPLESERAWVWVAFAIGHFGWGSYLAVKVYARLRKDSAQARD